MSSDLELPRLNLPSLKLPHLDLPSLKLPHLDLPLLKFPRLPESDGGSGPGAVIRIADGEFQPHHEDGCRTPTSEDNRIPAPSTCPPAPRRMIGRKRRRTSEVEGAEILKVAAVSMSHVEVEEFFCRIERVRYRERVRVVVKGDGVGKKSIVLLQLP